MTLLIYFPKQEIPFYGLGTINCSADNFEQKITSLLGYSKFPIKVAKIGLTLSKYRNGFFSYVTEPWIAIPLSFSALSSSIYCFQDPASSTALVIGKIALCSVVFAYTVKSTYNGSLRELSAYLWESSKKAKSYLEQIEKKNYTEAKFSNPLQISVKSTWSKIISIPANFINAVLERIHLVWLKIKSFFTPKKSASTHSLTTTSRIGYTKEELMGRCVKKSPPR